MKTLRFALIGLLLASCAPRARIDPEGIRPIESIAPVTFIANRVVRPPIRLGEAAPPLPSDPTLTTAEHIFALGIPSFMDALRRADRFVIVDASKVLGAQAYHEFPKLSGVNAGTAQLAEGWRYVTPEDGKKIAALLEEIGADAALLTYWRFTLDAHMQGTGVDTAIPRAYMRAWLVGRDGKVIADDEFDVQSDHQIAVYNQRYDGRELAGLYSDPIETCAVRLVADLSNARRDARKAPDKPVPPPDAAKEPVSTPGPAAPPG